MSELSIMDVATSNWFFFAILAVMLVIVFLRMSRIPGLTRLDQDLVYDIHCEAGPGGKTTHAHIKFKNRGAKDITPDQFSSAIRIVAEDAAMILGSHSIPEQEIKKTEKELILSPFSLSVDQEVNLILDLVGSKEQLTVTGRLTNQDKLRRAALKFAGETD